MEEAEAGRTGMKEPSLSDLLGRIGAQDGLDPRSFSVFRTILKHFSVLNSCRITARMIQACQEGMTVLEIQSILLSLSEERPGLLEAHYYHFHSEGDVQPVEPEDIRNYKQNKTPIFSNQTGELVSFEDLIVFFSLSEVTVRAIREESSSSSIRTGL